jgi:protein gp37
MPFFETTQRSMEASGIMGKTKIEWADHTINPVVGCRKCSPGCLNCYAERMAVRLAGNPKTAHIYGPVITNGEWNGHCWMNPTAFRKLPKQPARVFIGSMTDMLYEPAQKWLASCLYAMQDHPQHTFMLLTKRPNPSLELPVLPNLWLGVTACTQKEADEKIPLLRAMPATKRFISIEPMLEQINLLPMGIHHTADMDWVIVGGETGIGARPMNPDWARLIRDQCEAVGVPFFFKGMGGKGKETPADLDIKEFPK